MRKSVKLNKLLLFAVLFVLISINRSFAITQEQIPNGTLEIAYKQLTDGKLSESVHSITLFCYDGRCSMTTLTLNQCIDFPDGNSFFSKKSFYPKIERTSIEEGNLIVNVIEKGVIDVEEKFSSSSFKYRFAFKIRTDPSLSNSVGLRTALWFDELTNFSGAVIKQSDILNKVISWQLVPLKGRSVIVKPSCGINLKGVPQ